MELVQLFSLLKGEPSTTVLVMACIAVIVSLWLRIRKSDVESITSVSKIQQDHLQILMSQNKQLSDDLATLREKLSEQYELMQRMRIQIADLESEIRKYRSKCDDCPGPGGKPPDHGDPPSLPKINPAIMDFS